MRTIQQFELLRLPDELIALIIEHIGDQRTLRNLACTCHLVQDIAEAKLYRRILIRSGYKAKDVDYAFRARPKRVQALEFLDIPCDGHERQNYDALASILRSARRLKEIMFEGPACNSGDSRGFENTADWYYMTTRLSEAFQSAPLACFGTMSGPLENLQSRGSLLTSLPCEARGIWRCRVVTSSTLSPSSTYTY